jgi:hypothetical protein
MHIRAPLLATCIALIGVTTAGCSASSAPPPAKSVSVSISAPTDGATVGVRRIEIAGTVDPADAQVVIGGRRAPVSRGAFTQSIWLGASSQTITVNAQATGYTPAVTRTTVLYSPEAASQIAAAQASATTVPTFVGRTSAIMAASFSLPSASAGSPAGGTKGAGAANSAFPISGSGSASGSGSGSGSGSSSGSGSGSSKKPATTPPSPAQPQPLTAGQVHKLYLQACVKGNGGKTVTSFCRCTYREITLAGRLKTGPSLAALRRALRPYDRTHNPAVLPAYLHKAILECVQDLPGNSVTARPVLKRFPSLNQPQLPTSQR